MKFLSTVIMGCAGIAVLKKDPTCDLFNEKIYHIVSGDLNASGTKRCQECLDAEEKNKRR